MNSISPQTLTSRILRSLDSLDPLKFQLMTRRLGHDAVLRTLDVALNTSELVSLKLNAVIIRGLNDAEILDFVELTKEKSLSVRFIEYMPFAGKLSGIVSCPSSCR
jgi:cyclic pyranopterin phosphate synthase